VRLASATLGQQPQDGGHVEEHRGVWCHCGLLATAAMSCIES
jgi:hypothetical protein